MSPTDSDITVVIPTIPPREALLERALETVRDQTLAPHDIIVELDTGHTGHAATRQRGLDKVTTEYTAFLDDDDELYPQHLQVLREAIKDFDLAYSWFDVKGGTDPLACPVNGVLVNPLGVPFGDEQAQHLLNYGNFIPVTTLVRTETAHRVGGFPVSGTEEWPVIANEDWGFLIRLLKAGARFVHHPEKTWAWVHWAGNTSGLGDRW